MNENRNGKFKLGVIIAAILGVMGLGAIGGGISKGVKAVKVSKTFKFHKSIQIFDETGSLVVKTEDDASATNKIRNVYDGISKVDDAAKLLEDQNIQQEYKDN